MTSKSFITFCATLVFVAVMGANVAVAEREDRTIDTSIHLPEPALEIVQAADVPVVGDPTTFTPPVVDQLASTSIPNAQDLSEQIRNTAQDVVSGTTSTADIGPTVKCNILAPIGWPIPRYETECPFQPGTTTPPGNPGTSTPGTTTPPVDNPGGGGSTSTPTTTDEGVGGGGDSSSSSGGGSSRRSSSGGSNNNDGEVLGAEDAVGGGGDIPGVPETGAGGMAPMTYILLASSFLAMIVSGGYWYVLSRRERILV